MFLEKIIIVGAAVRRNKALRKLNPRPTLDSRTMQRHRPTALCAWLAVARALNSSCLPAVTLRALLPFTATHKPDLTRLLQPIFLLWAAITPPLGGLLDRGRKYRPSSLRMCDRLSCFGLNTSNAKWISSKRVNVSAHWSDPCDQFAIITTLAGAATAQIILRRVRLSACFSQFRAPHLHANRGRWASTLLVNGTVTLAATLPRLR